MKNKTIFAVGDVVMCVYDVFKSSVLAKIISVNDKIVTSYTVEIIDPGSRVLGDRFNVYRFALKHVSPIEVLVRLSDAE